MKKLYTIILLALVAFNGKAQAPNWAWAKRGGGIFSEEASGIAVDAAGNTYVTGFYASPNPGPYSIMFDTTTLTAVSHTDIFIAKYDASANLVWAKSAGGTGDDKTHSIAVDAAGNSYVTGYFNSPSITFDSITLTSTAFNDVFIAKYNAAGNVIWAKKAGGPGGDYSNSIAVDNVGNSYITGYFNSSSIAFGSTTLTNPFSSSGGYKYFAVKYDAAGSVVWAKSAGGTNDAGNSIAVDATGNTYLAGAFMATTSFDTDTLTSNGSKDIFIVKYDASGNVVWAKSAGGSNEDAGTGIAIDASGNSYITGYYKSYTIVFGTTTMTNSGIPDGNVLVAKYDALGNPLWAKQAISYGNDFGLGIAVDAGGNAYITGNYNNANIIFGSTTLTNTSTGTTAIGDFFAAKYDATGTELWAKNLSSSYGAWGVSIALDGAGSCYIAGFFEDPTLSFGSIPLTSAGGKDVYVAKIGTSSTVAVYENEQSGGIDFYPNPSTGKFIVSQSNSTITSEIEIYNIVGELIYKTNTTTPQTTIDLSGQPKGIYFVRTTDNKKNMTNKKITIQ